jgi:Ca2+-binding EF-hand superfamily protein
MLMYANDDNFAAADTNSDGKLSMDEMVTHHKEKIDAATLIGWAATDIMRVADKDDDGKVSNEEAMVSMSAFKHHLFRASHATSDL